MTKLAGGCLCGAVRYVAEGDIRGTSVCHCTHCQRVTGGAFSVNVLMPRAGVTYSGDGLTRFTDTAESGRQVARLFCARCGSSIASEPEAMAALTVLKAGSLDDRSWLAPGTHIWTASRQPWVDIPARRAAIPQGSHLTDDLQTQLIHLKRLAERTCARPLAART